MKKLFSLFAAMLVVLAVSATEKQLNPGTKVLYNAVAAASAGDVLVLADGVYVEPDVVSLDKNITIKAAKNAHPIISQQYYMKLLSSAQVTMIGLKFDGSLYPATDHCIRAYDGTEGKTLTVIDCIFTNFPNGYIFYPQKPARCQEALTIQNCLMSNTRGAVYMENSGTPLPLGRLVVENSTFENMTVRAISLLNSGNEVADAQLRIDRCTFYNCGTVRSEKSTDVIISNSIFAAPAGATYAATTLYGGAINNCLTYNVSFDEASVKTACITGDPLFVDAANGDLHIAEGSPVYGAGTDGSDLGDPRWLPVPPQMDYYLVGSMTEWKALPEFMLEQNPGNADEYMIELPLYYGSEFKIAYSDGVTIEDANWFPGGMNNNYVISASGDYTVYFRPDGQGGEGWHEGYIYAALKDPGPWKAMFFDELLNPTYDSYISYDAASGKVTMYIREELYPASTTVQYAWGLPEEGKCYRVSLKMRSNHDMAGVSLVWKNGYETMLEEHDNISLEEGNIYVYEAICEGKADPTSEGSTLYFGFNFVNPGDVVEIFDVVIEETTCPEPVETKYYLVGTMTEWGAETAYLFEANTAVEGEYILHTYLPEGAGVKVVGVAGEQETWYPDGMGNEYVVDAAHAGWGMVYFRPEGNTAWAAFGGYIYVDAGAGVEQVESADETVKFFKNGQLFVRKNGVVYTVLGEAVK